MATPESVDSTPNPSIVESRPKRHWFFRSALGAAGLALVAAVGLGVNAYQAIDDEAVEAEQGQRVLERLQRNGTIVVDTPQERSAVANYFPDVEEEMDGETDFVEGTNEDGLPTVTMEGPVIASYTEYEMVDSRWVQAKALQNDIKVAAGGLTLMVGGISGWAAVETALTRRAA